jgi:hypothetical protein
MVNTNDFNEYKLILNDIKEINDPLSKLTEEEKEGEKELLVPNLKILSEIWKNMTIEQRNEINNNLDYSVSQNLVNNYINEKKEEKSMSGVEGGAVLSDEEDPKSIKINLETDEPESILDNILKEKKDLSPQEIYNSLSSENQVLYLKKFGVKGEDLEGEKEEEQPTIQQPTIQQVPIQQPTIQQVPIQQVPIQQVSSQQVSSQQFSSNIIDDFSDEENPSIIKDILKMSSPPPPPPPLVKKKITTSDDELKKYSKPISSQSSQSSLAYQRNSPSIYFDPTKQDKRSDDFEVKNYRTFSVGSDNDYEKFIRKTNNELYTRTDYVNSIRSVLQKIINEKTKDKNDNLKDIIENSLGQKISNSTFLLFKNALFDLSDDSLNDIQKRNYQLGIMKNDEKKYIESRDENLFSSFNLKDNTVAGHLYLIMEQLKTDSKYLGLVRNDNDSNPDMNFVSMTYPLWFNSALGKGKFNINMGNDRSKKLSDDIAGKYSLTSVDLLDKVEDIFNLNAYRYLKSQKKIDNPDNLDKEEKTIEEDIADNVEENLNYCAALVTIKNNIKLIAEKKKKDDEILNIAFDDKSINDIVTNISQKELKINPELLYTIDSEEEKERKLNNFIYGNRDNELIYDYSKIVQDCKLRNIDTSLITKKIGDKKVTDITGSTSLPNIKSIGEEFKAKLLKSDIKIKLHNKLINQYNKKIKDIIEIKKKEKERRKKEYN